MAVEKRSHASGDSVVFASRRNWHQANTQGVSHRNSFFVLNTCRWRSNLRFVVPGTRERKQAWKRKPRKLAIMGGSIGGLLVGACMTQRPDLFGACRPAGGVMDRLRFEKFTSGWAWSSDYGNTDHADEFKALFAYPPGHNLKPGACYPPTLITTADQDDRLVPAHSFK